ncbi:MAG: twin-arginine translocation signal domain-containing protein [Anaerolineae bacterium]|nr:twin-arginine translocation signal domain-containing protein [Anaerolineae bacterium]
MSADRLTRRNLLQLCALTTGAAVATACGGAPGPAPTATEAPVQAPETTSAPEPTTAPAVASRYAEAPSLAAQVASGALPPVEERLPLEPLVVEPYAEVGQYSEDLHRVLTGPSDLAGHRVILQEGFVRWDRWDSQRGELKVIPNIAKGWDVSEDGRSYTFYLRQGMRWSDGEPFTADDIMFWYEAIALNKELSPAFPSWLVVGDEPPVISKVDDYAVKFTFPVPFGLLLQFMAFEGGPTVIAPKHYLSQFHPDYADADELATKIEEAGFEHWYELFADRNSTMNNPECPVVWAWKVEQPFPAQRMISVRNPYYWKVDPEGKQLPYFERVVVDLAENNEVVMMKTIAGEVDMQYRHMGFANYSLLKENEEKGGYEVRHWIGGPFPCVYVNQSWTGDPVVQDLLRNRDFRHALSYGINREEMNDLFWFGLATPGNPVGSTRDPFYKEGYGTTAIEYDPDRANELLDSIGLDQRDGEGFRLRSDGQRLRLLLECYPHEMGVPGIDIFGQVAGYWQQLGIDAQARELGRDLWGERADGNECMMPCYDIAKILWILDPGWFVPYGWCYWAPAFALWALNPEAGMEPPEEIKEIIDWYNQLKQEPDETKRLELGRMILDRHNENIYVIGTCSIDIQPMIVKNGIVNVPTEAPAEYRTYHEGIAWPFQLWRRK